MSSNDRTNSQRTQRPDTKASYEHAMNLLDRRHVPTLDVGAGYGRSKLYYGWTTYEPYPRPGVSVDYTELAAVPGPWRAIACVNVLNTVDWSTRAIIVRQIYELLAEGGRAVFVTRNPKDVLKALAKGIAGEERHSVWTRMDTYQKGFSVDELAAYLKTILPLSTYIMPDPSGERPSVVIERSHT